MNLFIVLRQALWVFICALMIFLYYGISQEITGLKNQLNTVQILTSVDYANRVGLPEFENVKRPAKWLKRK